VTNRHEQECAASLSTVLNEYRVAVDERRRRGRRLAFVALIVGTVVGVTGTLLAIYLHGRELLNRQSMLAMTLSNDLQVRNNGILSYLTELHGRLYGLSMERKSAGHSGKESDKLVHVDGSHVDGKTCLQCEMDEIVMLCRRAVSGDVRSVTGSMPDEDDSPEEKERALWLVTLTYGALSLGLPVLYGILTR
jgi:hypothetical protein